VEMGAPASQPSQPPTLIPMKSNRRFTVGLNGLGWT
jgi:hypothetical protein